MNQTIIKNREQQIQPISKEEAKKQFDYWTDKLSLKHTFSFDEVYDLLMERRVQKEKQDKFRKEITLLENKFKETPGTLGADPYPLEHSIVDGLYIRQVTVPADTFTVTKIHAVNHAFFLMKGTVSILTEDGVKQITAPFQGITKAGTKRVIYHHDEVIFTTVHSTKETDISKIEVEVIADNFADLDKDLNKQLIESYDSININSEELKCHS